MIIPSSPLPFPPDLMRCILKRVPLKTVLACTRVSKNFKSVVNSPALLDTFIVNLTKETFKFLKSTLDKIENEQEIVIPKTNSYRDEVIKKLFSLIILSRSFETWQGPDPSTYPLETNLRKFDDFYSTYETKHSLPDWRKINYDMENLVGVECLPDLDFIESYAMERLREVGDQWSRALGLKSLRQVSLLPVVALYLRNYNLNPSDKHLCLGIWKFIKNKDNDEWKKILTPLADQDNLEALYTLQSYEIAAVKGHIGAMCTLGRPRDSHRWLEQACNAGYAPAMLKYALLVLDIHREDYIFHTWTSQEIEKALHYLLMSSSDNKYARALLGTLLIKGRFIKRDYPLGISWLNRAKKESLSRYQMGRCYEMARGVDKDKLKAIEFYKLAFEQPKASFRLGALAEEGRNLKDALELYNQADALKPDCPKYLKAIARILAKQFKVLNRRAKAFEQINLEEARKVSKIKQFAQDFAKGPNRDDESQPKPKKQKSF